MKIKEGATAPDFSLPDQNGTEHKLSDYRDKWVLVYFYPKDLTPGCTIQARAIRDHHPKFKRNKIQVFGISADSVSRHRKFADKFDLPFVLLADEDKRVVKLYGVWGKKKFMGREFMGIHRMSFLVDPEGKVARIYTKVKPAAHAEEVLADRKTLARG